MMRPPITTRFGSRRSKGLLALAAFFTVTFAGSILTIGTLVSDVRAVAEDANDVEAAVRSVDFPSVSLSLAR